MTYLYLGIAIVSEVAATTFLKLSDGFSKPLPSLVTVVGYAVAFYFLSLTLRSLPTGVVYAVWSGVGVVLIATIAWVFQSQKLDHGGALRHGPDRLRGRRHQSVFQRFVAVNGCRRFAALIDPSTAPRYAARREDRPRPRSFRLRPTPGRVQPAFPRRWAMQALCSE